MGCAMHEAAHLRRCGVSWRNGLFTVENDGCGFNPEAAIGDHHLGLMIMHTERSGGQTADRSPVLEQNSICVYPCGHWLRRQEKVNEPRLYSAG